MSASVYKLKFFFLRFISLCFWCALCMGAVMRVYFHCIQQTMTCMIVLPPSLVVLFVSFPLPFHQFTKSIFDSLPFQMNQYYALTQVAMHLYELCVHVSSSHRSWLAYWIWTAFGCHIIIKMDSNSAVYA